MISSGKTGTFRLYGSRNEMSVQRCQSYEVGAFTVGSVCSPLSTSSGFHHGRSNISGSPGFLRSIVGEGKESQLGRLYA